jgi:uncharacterized repeat protein (TIGR01451 family)
MAAYGSDLTNVITVDSDNHDPRPTDNTSYVGVSLNTAADVEASATASAPEVTAGDQVLYTVQVDANGPNNSDAVILRYILPAGVTFNAEDSSDSCALASSTVTCSLGTVLVDVPKTRRIAVDTSAATPATTNNVFRAIQHSDIFDADPDNDTTSVSTAIKPKVPPVVPFKPSTAPIRPSIGGKKKPKNCKRLKGAAKKKCVKRLRKKKR